MNCVNESLTFFPGAQTHRSNQILSELKIALNQVPETEMKAWAKRSVKRLGRTTKVRAKNLANIILRIGKVSYKESIQALKAYRQGDIDGHMRMRGIAFSHAAEEKISTLGFAIKDYASLVPKLATHPKEAAPVLFGSALGFLVGSGGLDGDGGIPDLDLKLGIGFHRSILTHSILAGAFFESVIFSILDLTNVAYDHIPKRHDPIWDSLKPVSARFADSLTRGTDAGIALHLGIDGSIDGMTPFKDLPIHLSLAGHQAILGINAVAEAVEATSERPRGDDEKSERRKK